MNSQKLQQPAMIRASESRKYRSLSRQRVIKPKLCLVPRTGYGCPTDSELRFAGFSLNLFTPTLSNLVDSSVQNGRIPMSRDLPTNMLDALKKICYSSIYFVAA